MRSEERAHNERLANDRYREAGRDKHPFAFTAPAPSYSAFFIFHA